MSNLSYFCRRSAIWVLVGSIPFFIGWAKIFYDRYSFYGDELFTDPVYYGLYLNEVLTWATVNSVFLFGLWVFWALFIFRFPSNIKPFPKDDPRWAKIETTPNGRFVCAPDLRKGEGYYKPSKKFYFFRLGEQFPSHLKIVRVPETVYVTFKEHLTKELRAKMKIDMANRGYNALIDCELWTERRNGINVTCICGRPALLVSTNYPGDIDLLEVHCVDTFDDLIYGTQVS